MNHLSWKTCLRAGVTVVLVYLACTYWHTLANVAGGALAAASPLIIGGVIAYVVNILMAFYERGFFIKSKKAWIGKLRRPACMTLAFVTVIAAVAWMFSTVLPELGKCVEMIIASLPGALAKGYAWLDERFALSEMLRNMNLEVPGADFDWKTAITNAVSFVMTGVGGVVGAAASVVSSVLSSVVSGPCVCHLPAVRQRKAGRSADSPWPNLCGESRHGSGAVCAAGRQRFLPCLHRRAMHRGTDPGQARRHHSLRRYGGTAGPQ